MVGQLTSWRFDSWTVGRLDDWTDFIALLKADIMLDIKPDPPSTNIRTCIMRSLNRWLQEHMAVWRLFLHVVFNVKLHGRKIL